MDWYLQFDGSGSISITPQTLHMSTSLTTYKYVAYVYLPSTSSNVRLVGRNDSTAGYYLNITTTSVALRYQFTTATMSASIPFDDDFHLIEIDSDFSLHTLSIDGIPVSNTTTTGDPTNTPLIDRIGEINTISPAFGLGYLQFWGDGVLLKDWDATLSGGTGTVLPESVSADNGTQVNTWPVDDSEWVLYSAGFTGTITQSTASFTQSASGSVVNSFTGTITQTTSSFTQSASGTIVNPAYTGTITQTLSAFTQAASGTITASGFFGVITQTTASFTQSASGSVVLNTTGAINQTASAFTQSLVGLVSLDITGVINQATSGFTMSAVGIVPVQWIDKTPITTIWTDNAGTTTIWTDNAGTTTIWTDKI